MNTYIIREVAEITDIRDGETIQAWDLAEAKRIAESGQCYYGTCLVVETGCDERLRLAYKEDGRRWVDCC